jgi:hypothetical protein
MTDLPNPIPPELIKAACDELNEEDRPCRWRAKDHAHRATIRTVCRILWREGWRPPVHPDLIEAREIMGKLYENEGEPVAARNYRSGSADHTFFIRCTREGVERGRELGSKP